MDPALLLKLFGCCTWLMLAEKLLAQKREAEAVENYRQLLAEVPEYPGKPQIEEKLKALEQKLAGEKK